jgi:uncharacterized membrane protein
MEEFLIRFAEIAESLSEAAAVTVVTFGALEALFKLARVVITPAVTHGERKAIWRRFGVWLLLGLEFALAADIIGSVVSPTWQDIGELGAIAVIRTFLNYFLERDLAHAEESGNRTEPPLVRDERRETGAANSRRDG